MQHHFPLDTNKLEEFYDWLMASNDELSVQRVGWNSEYSQRARFAALSQVADLNGRSILDVGCGFGDLSAFLQERYKDFSYVGIDALSSMIEGARKKYPSAQFIQADFRSYESEKFDVVLASGALSIKISERRDFYFEMIRGMFERSNIALAFNVLNRNAHPDDEDFIAYTLPEVYEYCSTLTDRIIIRQDYLPHDITFYLYRSE